MKSIRFFPPTYVDSDPRTKEEFNLKGEAFGNTENVQRQRSDN